MLHKYLNINNGILRFLDQMVLRDFNGTLLKRNEYKMRHKEPEPYTLFFEEADKLKNNWEPIKQGMFGGSYDNYKQIYEQAEAYYQQHRKY